MRLWWRRAWLCSGPNRLDLPEKAAVAVVESSMLQLLLLILD
jgi:hypothetical protein